MELRIETRSSLIERIRDPADSGSWCEFVSLYEPLIRGLARQRRVEPQGLDDVVQEVFARVVRAAPEFQLDRKRGRFGAWLWTVVHHVVIDYFRQRRRRNWERTDCPEQVAALEAAQADPDRGWLDQQRRHVLRHALKRVRQESQATTWSCFERHLILGRLAEEVGRELGLSLNSVYVNASRVLAKVRQQCADYLEELGDG